jgi:hypothetical protein
MPELSRPAHSWRSQYQQDIFKDASYFCDFLLTAGSHILGVPKETHAFVDGISIVMGEGRAGLPDTIMYVPPKASDHRALCEELRKTVVALDDPEDRATLLDVSLQLLHLLPDGNKRLGSYMNRVLRGEATADPRFLGDEISKLAAGGGWRPFQEEARTLKRGPVLSLLGNYGQFASIFSPTEAFMYAGILAPGFDELTLRDKETVIREALPPYAHMPRRDREELILFMLASQTGFNPFKIVMLEALSKDGVIAESRCV